MTKQRKDLLAQGVQMHKGEERRRRKRKEEGTTYWEGTSRLLE